MLEHLSTLILVICSISFKLPLADGSGYTYSKRSQKRLAKEYLDVYSHYEWDTDRRTWQRATERRYSPCRGRMHSSPGARCGYPARCNRDRCAGRQYSAGPYRLPCSPGDGVSQRCAVPYHAALSAPARNHSAHEGYP